MTLKKVEFLVVDTSAFIENAPLQVSIFLKCLLYDLAQLSFKMLGQHMFLFL